MQILSFPEAATPGGLRVQVLELQREAWPSVGGVGLTHDPLLRPLSVVGVDGGVVVAALDVLFKDIVHGGRRFAAGGLSTVVTRSERRGRGYGRSLVRAARELMIDHQLDFGLFTCDRPLQGFYESAGWQVLPGAVLVGGSRDDPFPSDQPGFDKVTMGDFFTEAGRQAEASFQHARIELYPGDVDKLW
ncbi:GNAT family N-acetyltransferase [Kribbella sp. NPDC049174]|uniref:GNAT family N-acetyltransferase n=1 Tax=Kribbella sp. NPDC049174 TaxID=3364112 RepID=UPI0037108082